MIRNLYNQYSQPENRLTHALTSTLHNARQLLVPFLKWLDVANVPHGATLRIAEQTLGAAVLVDEAEPDERKGVPDGIVFADNGWAVLFECKAQAHIDDDQLQRHRRSAKRCGYTDVTVVLIAVDAPLKAKSAADHCVSWSEVYCWFNEHVHRSDKHAAFWARTFVEYLRVFEREMVRDNYQIRGALTVFDGFHFDDEQPYTTLEGKRLVRLLGDELQKNTDLHAIGVDPHGGRRTAITGRGTDAVWDFLPLKAARESSQFTSYPHFTISLNRDHASAAVTVPNGIGGRFRSRLHKASRDGFRELISSVERRLRGVCKASRGSRPHAYITQRYYKSQRSEPRVDARLDFDLRTLVGSEKVKKQTQWIDAVYHLLVAKKSNLQFGVEMRFDYASPRVRSAKAVDLYVKSWLAMVPLLDFVLEGDASGKTD